MEKKRITVGLSLLVGLLEVFIGLRDIFAPGFLITGPRIPGRGDIIVEFFIAAVFFTLAFLFSRDLQPDDVLKK